MSAMVWWHWMVIAVVLAAAETFLPGAVAIWFAVSAAFIGLVMVVFDGLPWQYQWLGFAVLGIVAMLAWRRNGPGVGDRFPDQSMGRVTMVVPLEGSGSR